MYDRKLLLFVHVPMVVVGGGREDAFKRREGKAITYLNDVDI